MYIYTLNLSRVCGEKMRGDGRKLADFPRGSSDGHGHATLEGRQSDAARRRDASLAPDICLNIPLFSGAVRQFTESGQ